MKPRILFLWYYYPWYLRSFYQRHAGVADLPYGEHRKRLLDDHFWWPADLCSYMAGQGYETEFVVGNDERLQRKWAEEHDYHPYHQPQWEHEIIVEQVRRLQPDVVWAASHFDYFGPFLRRVRQYTRKIMVWVGEPWPVPPDVEGISVLVTENPNTFKSVQHKFERVLVTKPGFCHDILEQLGPVRKEFDVTFVGQFTRVHTARAEIVAHLIRHGIRVKVVGLIGEDIRGPRWQALRSALWQLRRQRNRSAAFGTLRRTFLPSRHQRNLATVASVIEPPVYGMDMFRLLAASRLTLNVHGDIAGRYSGNMRMFEATGVGACLVTEHADNIGDLFVSGQEVLTYTSKEDLLALIRRALAGEVDIERIALAGQERTLRDHTLARVLKDLAPVLER